MSDNTQLTTASGYDIKRMIFSEPIKGTIPDSAITYWRILISTKNEDGTCGDLIIPTSKLFSFGVSENLDFISKELNGYNLGLCLYNRENPSQEEKDWVTTLNNIVEHCKDHMMEKKEEIEQWDLERSQLKKLNPLYYKKEKGKIVEGVGPTLYAKLLYSKKNNKISTMFYDFDGEPVDPLELTKKYCYARAAIRIESIFIGSRFSLQIKVYEAEVKVAQTGQKRLLSRPKPKGGILSSKSDQVNPLNGEDGTDDDSDNGSISSSSVSGSESDEPIKEPVKTRRNVKRVSRTRGSIK